MFFAREGRGLPQLDTNADKNAAENNDPGIELALFRSPGWPYSVFPDNSIASVTGEYRLRFSARSVLQTEGLAFHKGTRPVPMNFRARKPTGHDIAEDVRATGGIIDVLPEGGVYETTVYLLAGQTVEYGLLGLPSPQIDAQGKTGYYRYSPFPEGGREGNRHRPRLHGGEQGRRQKTNRRLQEVQGHPRLEGRLCSKPAPTRPEFTAAVGSVRNRHTGTFLRPPRDRGDA